MRRAIEPELLDELPPADPLARKSRGDLRRINWFMGHASLITRAFRALAAIWGKTTALRVVELGAGDGTFLLRVARRWSKEGVRAQVTFVDRQDLISEETRRAFHELDWTVAVEVGDVFQWLSKPVQPVHLIVCNLFLHHFSQESLQRLLQQSAARTELFIGCEPRRAPFALNASRLLWLIGCNPVTRHDAVISIRAGFAGKELSDLWSNPEGWTLTERPAGLFSHFFIARRHA